MNRVREAFEEQSKWCARLGSPFTAFVCTELGKRLTPQTRVGRAILDWAGDPNPSADSVPLRVCGALHALARAGRHPELSALYDGFIQDSEALGRIVESVLEHSADAFIEYLSRAPQTNEVGRSAAVMAGLLELDAAFRMPLALYELGASAGLNLIPDRYDYQLGDLRWSRGSPLVLAPAWRGSSPSSSNNLTVISRQGVDVAPIPVDSAVHRERLMSYVWPDQAERLDRLSRALELASTAGVRVEQGDCGAWLAARIASASRRGVVSVVFHTIVWSYLSQETRATVSAAIANAAASATAVAPFAWLRYELDSSAPAVLRLSTWPGLEDRVLAKGNPHGTELEWLGADE